MNRSPSPLALPRPVTAHPKLSGMQPFTPSVIFEEMQPGEERELPISGYSGGRYGIQRLMPGGPSVEDFEITLIVGRETTVLRRCNAEAIRRLYESAKLHSPLVVPEGTTLTVRAKNTGAKPSTLVFTTPGLPAGALEVYRDERDRRGLPLLAPRFFHKEGTIGAGGNEEFNVESGGTDALIHRMAFDSEGEDEVLASLRRYNGELFPPMTKRQVTDRYTGSGGQDIPYTVGVRTLLTLVMRNLAASERGFSFLAEAYYAPE